MIAYASLGLVVRHRDDGAEGRCLCGAPRGHPTAKWACTAGSSVKARIVAQEERITDGPPTSPWRAWRNRQDDAGHSNRWDSH